MAEWSKADGQVSSVTEGGWRGVMVRKGKEKNRTAVTVGENAEYRIQNTA